MPGELVNPDSTSSAATPLSSAVSTQTLVSLIVAEASIPAITDDRSQSDAATEPVSAMITAEATAAPEAVSLDALSALFAGELGTLLED